MSKGKGLGSKGLGSKRLGSKGLGSKGLGQLPPSVSTPLPGVVCKRYVDVLAAVECPALTARRARRAEASGAPQDPIVWTAASGANVVDADGNRFVDLSSGFGAAAVGHRHPRVVEAVKQQADRLLHALGDLHPSDAKVQLLERLAQLAPFADAKVILGLAGSDAVEAALKTALRATGKEGVLAFEGGYHGLLYGPLAACGYKEAFRRPFARQLNPHVVFAPYPAAGSRAGGEPVSATAAMQEVQRCWDQAGAPIGAVLVEPILGRGGVVMPPEGFLQALGALCRQRGAVLIADEIFTGLWRCGARWRSVEDGAAPDLICAGKALGGGLPVSACIGKPEIMAAWGNPDQEALHTGTFFGHPLACAAALATLDVLESDSEIKAAGEKGAALLAAMRQLDRCHRSLLDVRGAGMMVGLELDPPERALGLIRALLEKGYITVPAGSRSEVVSLTPPLTIGAHLLEGFVPALAECLEALS